MRRHLRCKKELGHEENTNSKSEFDKGYGVESADVDPAGVIEALKMLDAIIAGGPNGGVLCFHFKIGPFQH